MTARAPYRAFSAEMVRSMPAITGPSVWTGADLPESHMWGHMIPESDVTDLLNATKHAFLSGAVEWRAEL